MSLSPGFSVRADDGRTLTPTAARGRALLFITTEQTACDELLQALNRRAPRWLQRGCLLWVGLPLEVDALAAQRDRLNLIFTTFQAPGELGPRSWLQNAEGATLWEGVTPALDALDPLIESLPPPPRPSWRR